MPVDPPRFAGHAVRMACLTGGVLLLGCTTTRSPGEPSPPAPSLATQVSDLTPASAGGADRGRAAGRGRASIGRPFTGGPHLLAPPSVEGPGTLELSAVAAEVDHRLAELESCYQRRLVSQPALAGAVVIHWTIGAAGQVVESCVTEDTVEDPEVVACVNQLVTARPFPAPRGGTVNVSFPFVFTAAGTTGT
ncbi:MAG: AgmX/PglI C-terminal domain-containing protein [Kofleriaceae bacterium]|nr:AgmX/PglI C-terminal domain-containing protein [Kofleriaceae bacterium]MBP6835667.1 AgmX/PglI C-terminal domain-containing protein [Kofleriaceae bacterium]